MKGMDHSIELTAKKSMHVLFVSWRDALLTCACEVRDDQVYATFIGKDGQKLTCAADMGMARLAGDEIEYIVKEFGLPMSFLWGLRKARYDSI